MPWIPFLLHKVHLVGSRPASLRFRAALEEPEGTQRERLAAILRGLDPALERRGLRLDGTYEEFKGRVTPSTYADAAQWIDQQRRSGESCFCPRTDRWQPTSGSTDRRKWIPYPPAFRDELDAAAGAWLTDLARSHPGAFRGRHYWSLSWLPEDLRREGVETDDLSLLPAWKRWALGRAMAVPPEVRLLPTSEQAQFATAAWLTAAEDLSLLSVWSPTFALALLRRISEQRLAISEILRRGPALGMPRNARAARLLEAWNGHLDPGFFQELWPRLDLVSTWDSAGSACHSRILAGLLPQASLQGKGLWATEGVVSFPFRGLKPLALTSHFLEFRCLDTGRVLPAWSLEEGQRLQPLLTTSSGFLRYRLDDAVRVTGRCGRTPCIEFVERLGGTDMVGEKLDRAAVSGLLAGLSSRAGALRCLTLFAVEGDPSFYHLLAEGDPEAASGLQRSLEAGLGGFHHYRLARELGQLGAARVLVLEDATAWLMARARRKGQAAGEAKITSLERWDLPEAPDQIPFQREASRSPS